MVFAELEVSFNLGRELASAWSWSIYNMVRYSEEEAINGATKYSPPPKPESKWEDWD